jgi:hypothetical protein
MNATIQPDSPLRQALLDQIAAITTMLPGTLAEEYRQHPSSDGRDIVRLGPYFKHQIWENGRNVSRRVPAAEAATLKLDTDQAKRFHQLTDQLAQLNIQNTIALRATEGAEPGPIAEKKTSSLTASTKNTAKRNSTSPKRAKNSTSKKNKQT